MKAHGKFFATAFFLAAFLLAGMSDFHASAAQAAPAAAYFKPLTVSFNKKTGKWELWGQIVNNSQTHRVVRQDYRKVTYTTNRGYTHTEVKNEALKVTVPPMGVLKWGMVLQKTSEYEGVRSGSIKTDLRFSMMPAQQQQGGGGKTIIIK